MHLPIWADLLLRSTVLLVTAVALRRSLRAAAAAMRHRLLLCTFVLLALLPAVPEIRIPLLAAGPARAEVVVSQTSYALAAGAAHNAINWPLCIWLAGVLLALVPAFSGALFTHRMVRRAHPLVDSDWRESLAALASGKMPRLLLSADITVPLTFGIFRPCIVLPVAARAWTPVRRRAVLLHELAHIRRRDVFTQLSTHFIAALWWFQPLVWLLVRQLRAESELASDAAALASGLLPSDYAAELLAIARSLRRAAFTPFAGISMAHSGDLSRRVQTILAAGEAHKLPMRGRLWSSLSLLLAAAVGATTVTASFKQPQPQTGGIFVKRTLLSAMLASAGLSAATITGSIYDPSGATVPDAKLLLLNPDTGQKLETASGPDGKFGLADAPAGDYILRVEKPGFEPLLREFSLKENSVVERGLTLNAANASGNTPAAANSGRIRVRGQVAQDNLIHKVTPVYPAGAKQARLQGTVELNAVVSKEGVPVELQVIRSPGEELSQSALEAVRQWRYRPVLLNGNPVEIVTDVIVNYTLSQ